MTETRPAVVASTPGKLILMGEHAAVYGRPAVVAALDVRAVATFRDAPARGRVELDLPDLGVRKSYDWRELVATARRFREIWEGYARRPTTESFARLGSSDPHHLVKIALGETAEALALDGGRGASLRVESEIPVGSGFGSSAAVATSVVAGLRRWHGAPDDAAEVERLVLESERRQHGMPSGVDHATALRGGVIWASRREGEDLAVEPLEIVPGSLGRIEVYDTGPPTELTGTVVAAVGQRLRENPAWADRLLDEMEAAVRDCRRCLERGGDRMHELFHTYERLLEGLGVVPEPIRRLIRSIEGGGGAAKISGAGSLSGSGAGSLLLVPPSAGATLPDGLLVGCRRVFAGLGARGLQLEDLR